ncbi:3-hydroxyacyl-CoA dehydrogenase [Oceanibacterium hippocampi]|uniref:3-hydroxyadipyl-CoA dehydrogenase n=1 Tax=Oceanibacterium hippocampi TaxID=745714 RepID=A0A1Y5RQK2_9PROT|nr:3-hydroxyacyl-CoA dehydrogenase [Oceanibacterium hippocampi]SLN23044.1 3-hydroxyadipyl-CoA dehydrogenase [Oceanibacterium hippocampi]
MKNEQNSDAITVGIVGAGAMGRGIAQVSATGGMRVKLFDVADGAAAKARDFVAGMLQRAVEKGRMEADEQAAALDRISVAASIADLADCDLVVEAVVERLDVKQALFRDLEAVVGDDAILVSNTSSLRIAGIATNCTRPERVAGLHFFNPVPLMKLVEVIRAPATSPAVIERLTAISKRMGRVPVVVQDAPGFLVNLGGRAYTTEAMRIVSEGVAEPHEVDAIMRNACGFRMGPFELADLTGMDVNFPVSMVIFNGYFQDRRLATSPIHESMQVSGRLGRKKGIGFYRYDDKGNAIDPPQVAKPDAAPVERIALAEPDSRLSDLFRRAGAEILAADDGQAPLVAAPVGEDCTTMAVRLGCDPKRLIGIDMVTGVARCATVMAAPGADQALLDGVAARLANVAGEVVRIKDSPGFVAQRIRAMIANLGCEMAQIGVASPDDIDKGMTLGLNYPEGPLDMTDRIGAGTVQAILSQIQAITGDDRYRPSLWLRRRAMLGLPAKTPD